MKRTTAVRLKEQAGFTRLQNLMILVLAVILVSVGAYSFLGYQKSAYQVKADRTAERVFDIAEKYIRIEAASGRLEDLNIRAAKTGGVVSMDLQKESLKSRYTGRDFEGFIEEYQKNYRNVPVYYILMESEASGGENRSDNPVLDMFAYQMLDENITKHTFLIEYNGNTGEVLSVLYSEKADTFTYDGDREDKINTVVRDSESLNDKWQGYCGIDLEDL